MTTLRKALVAATFLTAIGCAGAEPRPARPDPAPSSVSPTPRASNDAAPPLGPRVVLPGTGVSLVPPPGVHLAPIGTTLTDDARDVQVSIAVGSVSHSLDRDSNWLAVFPGAPESVRVGSLRGTLRYRRRAHDRGAGAFDAWALVVNTETLSLTVTLFDKGDDPERWQRWKANVLSVEWNPADVDAERAFGLSAGTIPGMTLEKAAAGGLMYRASPPDSERITLLVSALPLVLPEGDEPCFEVLRRSSTTAGNVGKPSAFETNGFRGCEMESTGASGKSTYWSIVSAPDGGGTLFALGDAPSPSFAAWRPRYAAAVRSLRPSR